jgi:hypothetical protein
MRCELTQASDQTIYAIDLCDHDPREIVAKLFILKPFRPSPRRPDCDEWILDLVRQP